MIRFDQIAIFSIGDYSVRQIILMSWQALSILFFIPVIGYSFYVSFRRYLRWRRSLGIWLITAVILSILLLYSNLTIPYTIFTIVGLIIIALAAEFIQTKIELHAFQRQLDMLVNLRTAELHQTNAQLRERINQLEKVIELHRERERNAQSLTESYQDQHVQHVIDLDILGIVGDLISEINDLPTFLLSFSEIIAERFKANSAYVLITSDQFEGATVLQGYDSDKGPIKPILIDDLNLRDTPLVQENFLNRMSFVEPLMVRSEIQKTMLLPLWMQGEIKGMVLLCRRPAQEQFSSEDTRFAEALVTHLAREIENAVLVETVKEKAVREERERLARDMHDTVTQSIYTASLITEVLPRVWDRNPEEGKRNLKQVRQLVHGALAEMRTILFELRPSALEMASLETLIRQLVITIAGRSRIHVKMSTEGDSDLPRYAHVTIYRIAQEIFNNIIKHSEATHVHAILKMNSDGMTLTIADNGKGFLPLQASSTGMGLRIMQERAASIGARIDIDSKPSQGTIVMVTWNKNEIESNHNE